MTPYQWAWFAIAVAALVALFALARAARGLPLPGIRLLLGALAVVWVVLPAPIPNYPDAFAPAIVVFAFEWLFQQNGDPRTAARILIAGTLAVLAAGLVVGLFGWRRRNRGRPAST